MTYRITTLCAAIGIGTLAAAICGPPVAGANAEQTQRGRCPDGRAWTYDPAETARMLGELNAVRRKAGRAPLTRHPALDRMAQIHSVDMACRNYFNHRTPERYDLKEKLSRASAGKPPPWDRLAEVIGTSPTVPRQVERWLDSRGHRQAVLDREHDEVGIGLARIASGSRYTTYWTVNLMRERRTDANR
jgi:uncharacterized protein YkwD